MHQLETELDMFKAKSVANFGTRRISSPQLWEIGCHWRYLQWQCYHLS